jgi:hypothetical protein
LIRFHEWSQMLLNFRPQPHRSLLMCELRSPLCS